MENENIDRCFTFASLCECLQSLYQEPRSKDNLNITCGMVMGDDRLEIAKMMNETDLKAEKGVSYQAKFYKGCGYSVRESIALAVNDNDETELAQLTYPKKNDSNLRNLRISHAFLFAGILRTSPNIAKRVLENQLQLPKSVRYFPGMEIVLYNALFHSPIGHDEHIDRWKGDEEKLQTILIDDFTFQTRFCEKIYQEINKDEDYTFTPVHSSKNAANRFYQLMVCSCVAYQVKKETEAWVRLICAQLPGELLLFLQNKKSELENACNSNQPVLHLALHCPKTRNNHDGAREEWSDFQAMVRRVEASCRYYHKYQPLLYVLTAQSILAKEGKKFKLDGFLRLFQHFCNDSREPPRELEAIILGKKPDCPVVLEKIIFALFDYSQLDETVSPRASANFWYSAIFEDGFCDRAVFVPEELQGDKATVEHHCDMLFDQYFGQDNADWMKDCPMESFSQNGCDEVFRIQQCNGESRISVNFNDKVVGGKILYPIPEYAAVFYKLIPAKDFGDYGTLDFQICSQDKSLIKMKIEVKNKERRNQHTYPVTITEQWENHSLNLNELTPDIRHEVEEICFVLTPMSFTDYSDLRGEYRIKEITVTK